MTEAPHRLFKERVSLGLLAHVQARVLARTLRGDCPLYEPYVPQ